MKNLLFTFLIILFIRPVMIAQERIIESDSLNKPRTKKSDNFEINKALTIELANLLTNQGVSSLGNFADLSTDDGIKFSSTFLLDKAVLVGDFEAGAINGVASIFTNSNLNTTISAGVGIHFINRDYKDESISYNNTSWRLGQNLIEQQGNQSQAKIYYYKNLKIEELQVKINTLKKQIISHNKLLKTSEQIELLKDKAELERKRIDLDIKKKEAELMNLPTTDKLKHYKKEIEIKDSKISQIKNAREIENLTRLMSNEQIISYQNERLTRKIDSLQSDIDTNTYTLELDLIEEKKNKKIAEIKENYKLDVTGVNIGWFSLNYKVNNYNFQFYDGSQPFDQQLDKKQVLQHTFSAEYSIYKWNKVKREKLDDNSIKKLHNYYLNFGAEYGHGLRIGNLSEIKLIDTALELNDNVTRVQQNEINALTGVFSPNIDQVSAFIDYYHFLMKNNELAIHINPEYQIIEGLKPNSNATFGLLYSVKDKDQSKKSYVNIEVFYSFRDIFDTQERLRDLDLLQRNIVGLKVSLPISFKQNYKQ